MKIGRFGALRVNSALEVYSSGEGANTYGPDLDLYQNNAAPAVTDEPGRITLWTNNSAGTKYRAVQLFGYVQDPTSTSEDTRLYVRTVRAGTWANRIIVGAGLHTPGASDMGADTINAVQLYEAGTRVATLGVNTFADGQVIESTDAGAAAGPVLTLRRDSASPAVGDSLGRVLFQGRDSGGGLHSYAALLGYLEDPTDASEDGRLYFQTSVAGAFASRMWLGTGLIVGTPNGGDQAGTVNAEELQVNSFPVYATRKAYATADQGPGFAADTYVTGSRALTSYLNAGAKYRFTCRISKTAAGTATPIVYLRAGTAGTTADTAIATLTFPAQTAAIDDGRLEVEAYFTAVGGAAVCRVTARITHALSITGLSTSVSPSRVAVASSFNADTASMGLGISLNGGASASWTVSNANAELDSIG